METFLSLIKYSLVILIFYIIYIFILYIYQDKIIFPGHFINNPFYNSSYKNIIKDWIKTENINTEVWYLPSSNVNSNNIKHKVIIFAHGNFELIDYCVDEFKNYNNLGYSVLLVEFAGYGRSEGVPSIEIINKIFINAYDWLLKQKNIDRDNIIVHGRSIGGGIACALTKNRKIKALILQSTFTSLNQFAYRYLALPIFLKDNYNNLSIIKKYTGPTLFIHGKLDKIISFKNSEILFKNSLNGKLITLNCGHNDCPDNKDFYWEKIKLFLNNLK